MTISDWRRGVRADDSLSLAWQMTHGLRVLIRSGEIRDVIRRGRLAAPAGTTRLGRQTAGNAIMDGRGGVDLVVGGPHRLDDQPADLAVMDCVVDPVCDPAGGDQHVQPQLRQVLGNRRADDLHGFREACDIVLTVAQQPHRAKRLVLAMVGVLTECAMSEIVFHRSADAMASSI